MADRREPPKGIDDLIPSKRQQPQPGGSDAGITQPAATPPVGRPSPLPDPGPTRQPAPASSPQASTPVGQPTGSPQPSPQPQAAPAQPTSDAPLPTADRMPSPRTPDKASAGKPVDTDAIGEPLSESVAEPGPRTDNDSSLSNRPADTPQPDDPDNEPAADLNENDGANPKDDATDDSKGSGDGLTKVGKEAGGKGGGGEAAGMASEAAEAAKAARTAAMAAEGAAAAAEGVVLLANPVTLGIMAVVVILMLVASIIFAPVVVGMIPQGGGGTVATSGSGTTAGGGSNASCEKLTGTPKEIIDDVILPIAHEIAFENVTPESVATANASHGATVSGGRSDHHGPPDVAWAADISNGTSPTPEMDELAKRAAECFDIPWSGSGLVTGSKDGYTMQVIYRTNEGGNHYNHVHVGLHVS